MEDKSKLQQIKRQVEFYFSNANFSKDKFLYETAEQSGGKVKIEILLTFKRMKNLEATKENVEEALKESKIVKVEDGCCIKLDMDEFKKYVEEQNVNDRTVAITNFDTEMTLDEIDAFLKETCAPVRILMRRRKNKVFSGTCFVEFATVEEAKNALSTQFILSRGEEENKTKVELKVTTKEAHLEASKTKVVDKEVEKIKKSFIPKLYTLITEKECVIGKTEGDVPENALTFAKVKEACTSAAFVDFKKFVVRMKVDEAWEEKEFEGFTLKRMPEDEARAYVDSLDIKVKGKKKGKIQKKKVNAETKENAKEEAVEE